MQRPCRLYPKAAAFDLGRGKKDGDAAISNSEINTKIRCGKSAHVGDSCRQQHCIQNCGQTAADRDMDMEIETGLDVLGINVCGYGYG